MFCFFFPF
uniref:Uncharacterized protein n=1 Tax=Anguilla anguilla TaxID=7936 RepID=A0A0E9TXZ6_ANGAN